MNEKDKRLMEKYSQAIFGCSVDDLSEKEEKMLMYHIMEHEPSFMNHPGLTD